ncbi:hypothetical protein Tco_0983129 [Tanacetum coccineum]
MCDWDEEEVSSDDNEVTEVKALMALTNEERVSVGKESAKNGFDEIKEFFLPTAKGVGLRVADSHTGNHPEDDFMPLKTIRRLCSVFGRRSHLGFEGETSEPKGREYFSVLPKLDEFLSYYPIPLEYRVILPTSTQTILDAPPRYIGLYTHCFSLANLRLPLNDFFCEVYDYEPFVELFHGFFNLCKAGSWLTFQKRSEKHIPSLLANVITRIEGWHKRFFFIQDTIVPSKFPQLLLKGNMLNVKSFKDKLPSASSLHGNMANNDLQSLWPARRCLSETLSTSRKMRISLSFLRIFLQVFILAPLLCLLIRSLSGLMKSLRLSCDRASRIRERKCKTKGGSLRPPVKRKLASGSSTSRIVHAKASTIKDDTPVLSISDDEGLKDCLVLKDATACHLKISAITPLVTPPKWVAAEIWVGECYFIDQ